MLLSFMIVELEPEPELDPGDDVAIGPESGLLDDAGLLLEPLLVGGVSDASATKGFESEEMAAWPRSKLN